MRTPGLIVIAAAAVTGALVLWLRQPVEPSSGALKPPVELEKPVGGEGLDRVNDGISEKAEQLPQRVAFSMELLKQRVEQGPPRIGRDVMGRDRMVDRLLERQGRDSKSEEALTDRMLDQFAGKPEVAVSDVLCGTDLCRIGIDVPPGANATGKYARDLLAAATPQGESFFLEDGDETIRRVTFYFGRVPSWKFQEARKAE